MTRWLGALALSLAAFLASAAAMATPTYPDEVKKHLGLSGAPACALCHQDGITGYGTVNTPFGKAMRARGLVALNPTALDTALDQLQKDGVDSDGDGVPDIVELMMGTDPNTAGGGGTETVPDPTYGCVGTVAPAHPASSGTAIALTMLAGAIALARRRRVRRAERSP